MSEKKIFCFFQVAIFLVSTVSGIPHARALEIATVTAVTTERNGAQNGFNQNVQQVDEVVNNLFQALNENDYEKFLHYFNLKTSSTLSGSSGYSRKLSKETFTAMRDEMLQKGGHFISKKMISGSESMKWVRNDYQATFEKNEYTAQIGVIATSDTGDSCVATFWIYWFDSRKTNAVNHATDEILLAINQNDYTAFSKCFTNELKLKYTAEDFAELQKNIVNELGIYRRKENTFFAEKKGDLSISSDLYYEKAERPFKFIIDASCNEDNLIVKNITFQWVPAMMLEQTDLLAEQALITVFNENDYEKFISYCDSRIKTVFTEEQFKQLKVLFNPAGKYISKQYVGKNYLQTSTLDGKKLELPIESTVFLYKLTFENEKELYLNIATVRKGNCMFIQQFYINAPTGLAKATGTLEDVKK